VNTLAFVFSFEGGSALSFYKRILSPHLLAVFFSVIISCFAIIQQLKKTNAMRFCLFV